MKTLSIVIPTYEMKGLGRDYLRQSFDMLARQTFQDFNVIVSDHSQDDGVRDLCAEYANRLTISYHRNAHDRGNSSANLNNAIRHATGALIKILFQDDFLYHDRALEDIVRNFDMEKDRWLVTACIHTKDGAQFFKPFRPRYNPLIYLANNTISSPSVLTIKNDHPLFFDERLLWVMDCDYYKRLHDTYGEPRILDSINVVNRVGSHQITNIQATEDLKYKEFLYMLEKYEKGLRRHVFFIIRTFFHLLRKAL